MRSSSVLIIAGVFIGYLPKPAQHKPVVEFALLEIAGAAERYCPGVPEKLPLPLCRLDRERGTCAVNGFTGNKPAIDEIESQCNETGDFDHEYPLCKSCLAGQFV
jgi:hypothetical protein